MNYNELVAELKRLGVTPPDTYRASLYLDYLQAAQQYFSSAAGMNIPANNYNFVRSAVRSTNLLNEMAEVFDLYIGAAVEQALFVNAGNNWDYAQFFNNVILGNNYAANLAAFRNTYTVSTTALQLVDQHFRNNIREACTRVFNDRPSIATFYEQIYNRAIIVRSLKKIKSSGSDFHKGGKQVLILTYLGSYEGLDDEGQQAIFYADYKLVYKPSDIELDCLIAGKSGVVNAIHDNFMNRSLFEIYNERLRIYKAANPAFDGLPVTTYGILPMVYQSIHGGGPPLPVRNAYGYIEYLNHDLNGAWIQFFGYYPYAQSDYLIFKSLDKNQIINDFYRTVGAMTAIACTFSIQDLHLENLRVKNYLPYFIDMEISLTKPTDIIENTVLISNALGDAIGGINGICLEAQKMVWEVNDPTNTGRNLGLDYTAVPEFCENRLWEWANVAYYKRNIPVNENVLQSGFDQGMLILKEAQGNNDFNAWFNRIQDVVVRYIPFPTAYFKNNFIATYYLSPQNATGNTAMATLLQTALTDKFNNYQAPANPNFLVLNGAQCLTDLLALDIPIYYYRVGMQDILDSDGNQVQIPATIQIDNNNPPPATVQQNVNIGRNTFLANIPPFAIIQAQQLNILTTPLLFLQRKLALSNSISDGLDDAIKNPTLVIPINN
ncbi:hypothetical protein COR50_13915 [Chitinophaga caeni]|uniref:Lantibiotic biosynthesis protein dehydration domain-containing protein n=1 Tax=Chitinophaga caeni TaxID=2029983 RepID=A0A291QW71_9BACT|nr:DUF4135 domain-containing protein [Chitinophaga caeni]ATL48171.1 hypothetical protein COR50_13915 [Chitinophaga caeni]